MKGLIRWYISFVSSCSSLPPLIFRLILAYGFYEPATQKWSNIQGVIEWFTSLGYPAPALNAYMAASTESLGVVLLLLGLGIRFITIPLMVIMVVAITTVHLPNGFSCGKNGWEIPFYYFFMLFSLLVTGAGCISLDALLKKKFGTEK